MSEVCHRCQRELPRSGSAGPGAALSTLDDEVVLFCPRCGAPQLRLPEHLRSTAVAIASESTTGAPPPPRLLGFNASRGQTVDWPAAIRCGALIAVVEVLGIVLQNLAPSEEVRSIAFSTCLMLLIFSALIAVNLYARLAPTAPLTGRTGLRIGLVSAVILLTLGIVAVGFTGVVSRFLLHSMASSDAEWLKTVAMVQASTLAAAHGPDEAEVARRLCFFMSSPEGHGGMVLGGFAFYGVFFLLLSAGLGAFAGLLKASGARLQQGR
jgi:hypothetical protein